jgi:sucrose phosphorylase
VTFFNFLASHDGIGLNPARGLLTPAELEALVAGAVAHGGYVSYKHNPDGSQSPYELNVSYFDALSDPAGGEPIERQVARFLCAHSIELTLQGVPGIYVHSLLGSRGDRAAAEESGMPRRVNRAKLDRDVLEEELNRADSLRAQVYRGFVRMLRARCQQVAFRPSAAQRIHSPVPEILIVERGVGEGADALWCVHNVSAKEIEFDWAAVGGATPARLRDRLGGLATVMAAGRIRLRPYEVFWFGA